MFGKVVIFVLALAVHANGQSCLSITGSCLNGQCPAGQSCLSNICCITDAATTSTSTTVSPTATTASPSNSFGVATTSTSTTVSPTATTVSPSSSSCVDKVNPSTGVSDCPKDAYLCNNPIYYDLMTQQCSKTCRRCSSNSGSPATSSSTCVDKVNPLTGVSACPQDAYLCNNPIYFTLMTQQCPKTCGRC